MSEVIELVNLIRQVSEKDRDAREKLELYWRKLFLLEKTLFGEDEKGISFFCTKDLMQKNVYQYDFGWNFIARNALDYFLKSIKQEMDMAFYAKGEIVSPINDSYYQCCSNVSYLVSERVRKRRYKSKQVAMENIGINNVPHFFSPVFRDGEMEVIVDLTFRQFMLVPFFIPERIYHFEEAFLSPVSFGNEEFFRMLSTKGFFKATPENVKIYFDGFALASETYRNEDVLTRKLFKTPDTSGEEYINRIKDYTL